MTMQFAVHWFHVKFGTLSSKEFRPFIPFYFGEFQWLWISSRQNTSLLFTQKLPEHLLKLSSTLVFWFVTDLVDIFCQTSTKSFLCRICFDLRTSQFSNSGFKKVTKKFPIFAKMKNFDCNFHIYPAGSGWWDLVLWVILFSRFHLSCYPHSWDFLKWSLKLEILLVIFTKRR